MTNYTIDLKLIYDILKKENRNYLNIKKLEDDNNELFILSYKKIDTGLELKELDYIKEILNKYVNHLNDKKDKTISLIEANIKEYEVGRSFILDFISQSWEGYKAGESLIKYIIKKGRDETFSFEEEFLVKLLKEEEYTLIIFFIDKMIISINNVKLKSFIKNIPEKQLLIDFASLSIDELNNILISQDIGDIKNIDLEIFNTFQDSLKEIDIKNIKKSTLETFIMEMLFSLQMKPHNLGTNIKRDLVYNKKDIIKSNKTEAKIDKTFSNDIFHLALCSSITKI